MWYIIGLYAAFVVGGFVGAYLNPEETCPRVVKGYDCRGNNCDHSKVALYQAKLDMARNDEDSETKNYWGGPHA